MIPLEFHSVILNKITDDYLVFREDMISKLGPNSVAVAKSNACGKDTNKTKRCKAR